MMRRLAAGRDLFAREAGPRERHPLRQHARRQCLHRRQRLARAVAGRRRPVDRDRAEQVVVVDVLRRGALANRDHVAQRHHLTGAVPHRVALDVAGVRPELAVGLHVDAIRPVVEVEIVHVRRPQQNLHRLRDVAERDAEALRLLAIDRHDELRIVGRELREHAREARRLVRLPRQVARGVGEILDRAAGLVEQLVLEPAEVAEARDRRRQERKDHARR